MGETNVCVRKCFVHEDETKKKDKEERTKKDNIN